MEGKNKTMSYFEYFLKHIPLAAWLSFMYYMILFVNIPGVTVDMSKVVYFVGIQLLWLLLSVATPAKRRSKQNAVFDVALSYIPYLMITCLPVYKHILIPFIIVTVVLCAIYFAIVLSKKVKNNDTFKMHNVRAQVTSDTVFGVQYGQSETSFGVFSSDNG